MSMEDYRTRIDAVDERLVGVLAERMALVREVAVYKKEHGVDVHQPDRMRQLFARVRELGDPKGLDPDFVEQLYRDIVDEAMRIEHEVMGSGDRE